MAEKRKRCQNFSFEEKDKLIKIVSMYKDSILNKKTDGPSNEAKANAWVSVTARFNSSTTTHRSKYSLVRVWEKLKGEAKLYKASLGDNLYKTDSDQCVTKIDPILEQVCTIVGQAGAGNLIDNDSDADVPTLLTVEMTHPTDIIDTEEQDKKPTQDLLETTNGLINGEPNCNDFMEVSKDDHIEVSENNVPVPPTKTPPIWPRKRRHRIYRWRPIINQPNERTEVANSLCSSNGDLNQKRLSIEELKCQLLTEEIEFKRKLYKLQLESATIEVQIKTEVLKQVKDGRLALHLFENFQQAKETK